MKEKIFESRETIRFQKRGKTKNKDLHKIRANLDGDKSGNFFYQKCVFVN